MLVVVYEIQPSSVVELQKHSPLSNNTSVTAYVHRLKILPPSLFKHMKNDERIAMLFQSLMNHIHHILYFCLISLLRNVSKSVHINLRQSVCYCTESSCELCANHSTKLRFSIKRTNPAEDGGRYSRCADTFACGTTVILYLLVSIVLAHYTDINLHK